MAESASAGVPRTLLHTVYFAYWTKAEVNRFRLELLPTAVQLKTAGQSRLVLTLLPAISHLATKVAGIWSHGVMVSTLDFESSDPSSSLGGTCGSQFCVVLIIRLCIS